MRDVIFDIETNGFLDDFDTIHCLVILDIETGEVLSCTDAAPGYASIAKGLEVLANATTIYGHNIVRFDIPAIKKLHPDWEYVGTVRDTIVATRVRFAHIKESDYARAKKRTLPTHLIGRQSIESWGYRLGEQKTDYKGWCEKNGIEEPFAEWRPEMQDYCIQDCRTNLALLLKLREAGIPMQAFEADMELAFYLAQQERNGWPIDEEHLSEYIRVLTDKKLELEEKLIEHFGSWYEPKDDPSKGWTPKADNKRYGYVKGAPCVRLELKEFNPRSNDQIAQRLTALYGWEPTAFTPTGKAQVDESTLSGLTFPMIEELKELMLIQKRLGQASEGKQAWVKHLTRDAYQGGRITGMSHIHHSISQVTVTHRHRHSHPNLGQVPALKSPYGKESRAVFTVPSGWKQIGSDAAGLELRCLAHYMAKYDDGAYGKVILEGKKEDGTDIHSLNQKALGLPDEMPEGSLFTTGRDVAKTFIYAWLYGAGDVKIGSIIKPLASEKEQRGLGKKLKTQFLNNTPALKYLKQAVDRAAENKGYLLLPDGRPAFVRHKHAALNTLLQGAGSILCKHWIVQFNRDLACTFDTPAGGGWEYAWAALGWIHDEVQIAALEKHAEDVAKLLVTAMPLIGEKFNWRIPLAASADIGDNWADTH